MSKARIIDSVSEKDIENLFLTLDTFKLSKALRIMGRGGNPYICNCMLIKVLNHSNPEEPEPMYFIKRDGMPLITLDIKVAEDNKLLTFLEKNLFLDSNNLCKFTINKSYIKSNYDLCDISIVLFSENIIKRTKTSKYVVCGLLFLEERNKSLYLSLICAKRGIGGLLLKFAEMIGRFFKYQKIILTSVDKPMPVYIHKGYKFMTGTDTFDVENDVKIIPFKENLETGDIESINTLTSRAYYENNMGRLTSATTSSIGKRKSSKLKKLNKKLKLIKVKKTNDNSVYMYKDLVPPTTKKSPRRTKRTRKTKKTRKNSKKP